MAGFVVGFVVAGVAERTGTRARCHAAAIFFSPDAAGWMPSAWLSAAPLYPAYRSTTLTGEDGVERPAASDGRALL